MDLGLGILGLELLREKGELRLGAGAQHEALLPARSHQFKLKRLVGGAGLEPGLHGLRLALPLLVWHDHDQVCPALLLYGGTLVRCGRNGRGRGEIVYCGCRSCLRHVPMLLLSLSLTICSFGRRYPDMTGATASAAL